MGALHKAMVYLGFSADEYGEYPGYDGPPDSVLAPVTTLHDVNHPRSTSRGQTPSPLGSAPPTDLRKIQKVVPRTYNDALGIGKAFREGVPVIMNLTEMPDAEAKRLVDFAAGLSFGLRGSLERVTQSVFLLSPAYIEIEVESEPGESERGLFNQN